MAEILEQCEKEIVAKLKKLDEFKKSLEDALEALRRVRQQHSDLPALTDLPDVSTFLQDIVAQTLSHHLKATDIIAESTPPANVQNQKVDSDPPTVSNVVKTVESTTPPQEQPTEISKNDETDQLIEHLLRVAGAKKGVKYKIEVTSPLSPDGTFWACHVESGFIHSKLEPLSERLKNAIQRDKRLWRVDKLTQIVCAKSSSNGLWMRATILKEINENMVKVRFVDIGSMENCAKSQLSKVPDVLATIPFMAFNCALIKGPTNLGYDAKWRFSDLTKKKILNFTVEDMEERNGLTYLFGKLETILDEPMININEEIRKFDQRPTNLASRQENILSRDIRTNNGNMSGNFTSVSEVIRNSEPEHEETIPIVSSTTTSTLPSISKRKEVKNLPPLCIASTPPTSTLNWGESKTPGAEDELELQPLDERLFETGPDKLFETEIMPVLSAGQTLPNANQLIGQLTENTAFVQGQLDNVPLTENDVLQCNLRLQMAQDMQLSHKSGHQALPFHNGQARSSPLKPIGSPAAQMPIGTRPKSSVNLPHTSYFSEDIQRVNDYAIKMQQLEAITRSLTMPSDCLDDQQMKQLQITKQYLEQQLHEEEIRKNRMEQMLRQSTIIGSTATSNQGGVEQMQLSEQAYSSLRPEEMEKLIELERKHFNHSPYDNTNKYKKGGYGIKEHEKQVSQDTGSGISRLDEQPLRNNENSCVREHSNAVITQEMTKFEKVPYDSLFTESKNEWVARELINLTHPYFELPNTRFYTVLHSESRPGIFTPRLESIYKNGYFWFTDSDAMVFQKEWDLALGHVFLLVKHKPYRPNEAWRVGGIIQVLSKIQPVPAGTKVNYNYQCLVKFVSLATVNDDQSIRSDKLTWEIPKETVKRFIKNLLSSVQGGRAVNIFHFLKQVMSKPWTNEIGQSQEYLPRGNEVNQNYEQAPPGFACQPIQHHPIRQKDDTDESSHGENWDLDLQENTRAKTSVDYGSGDESERDLNAEIEAFGLSKEDLV